MKKKISILILLTVILIPFPSLGEAKSLEYDSTELKVQDLMMLLVLDSVATPINEYYFDFLKENPVVYPYEIELKQIERMEGFRSFHFVITLEVTPVIGPHIAVGKDVVTLEVSPVLPKTIKVLTYEHLETYELPAKWRHVIKKPKIS
ncbi:DUF3888 domain-containing protein [Alkalihalophilus sp. As8PL]|uniref:DUF3888 domain-containing protein n=1 Tax=Alkalihalophilus sp. As8PL TaxID=3237103 RepID=A0AB39BRC7_9BACI